MTAGPGFGTPSGRPTGVPGVEFLGDPRRTGEVPSIRGFARPDVIITIDVARPNYNSGHDGRFFLDPSLLREVEVLRGSASSRYGSGGLGGVLELRTLEPADVLDPGAHLGLQASIGGQNANRELVTTVTGAARMTEDLDAIASLTRRASGSIRLGDGSKLDAADDASSTSGSATTPPGSATNTPTPPVHCSTWTSSPTSAAPRWKNAASMTWAPAPSASC